MSADPKPVGSGWPGVTPQMAEALTPLRLTPEEYAGLAVRSRLRPVGSRPPLRQYLRSIWARRHFLWELSAAKITAQTSEERLGGLWQVINPVLSAAVYYFAFGVMLNARSGIDNYVLFLIVGVFVFTLQSRIISIGAQSVVSNKGLLQALRFPRAVLPLSVSLRELVTFVPSLIVMVILAGVTEGWPRLEWLGLVPAIGLAWLFASGMAMLLARLVAWQRDLAQLVPFVLRLWLYVSGVFMNLDKVLAEHAGPTAIMVAHANPGYAYLELARGALMPDVPMPMWAWQSGILWALGALLVGFVVFWSAEEEYGRER